jgi:DNA-binding NarL/FixJ family response regulator
MATVFGGLSIADGPWASEGDVNMSDNRSEVVRAIIADDHRLMRIGIREMLAELTTIEIVAEATNGIEAVSSVKIHQPDLLIVDIAMPYANGIEVIEEVKRWSPKTHCVVLTGMTSVTLLHQATLAGAAGIFHKSGETDEIVKAIPDILAGKVKHSVRFDLALAQFSRFSSLSPRELEVMQCLARGESLNQIAEKLSNSRNTVDKHRTAIMRKLDVHSTPELLALAYREGMLETSAQL